MSKLSTQLQLKSLKEMGNRKPYTKNLAGFKYTVLPKVYKGSTDTELFCKVLKIKEGDDVWDIGTGTGLVALTAKKKGAHYVLASDFNKEAIRNAKENSEMLGIDMEVKLLDVFGNTTKKFDLITFNPPFTNHKAEIDYYISFWDHNHTTLRKFLRDVGIHLKPRGRAQMAWSSFAKVSILRSIAKEYGFSLKEIARKVGKRKFVYYIFELISKN